MTDHTPPSLAETSDAARDVAPEDTPDGAPAPDAAPAAPQPPVRGFARSRPLAGRVLDALAGRAQNAGAVTGRPAGFEGIDRLTGGLQPGDLVALAGRPGSGKSSFARNVAAHLAITERASVGLFSAEADAPTVMTSLLVAEARVTLERLRAITPHAGVTLPDDDPVSMDLSRVVRAFGILSHAPLHISDPPVRSVRRIVRQARRLKEAEGLDLLIVDYLQLLETGRRTAYRAAVLSEAVRDLKALSLELGVPLLLLSQIARDAETRRPEYSSWTGTEEAGRPALADLRDAGTLEEDADVVIFLWRPELHAERTAGMLRDPSLEGRASAIVAKQRRGPTGEVPLFFHAAYGRYETVRARAGTTGAA